MSASNSTPFSSPSSTTTEPSDTMQFFMLLGQAKVPNLTLPISYLVYACSDAKLKQLNLNIHFFNCDSEPNERVGCCEEFVTLRALPITCIAWAWWHFWHQSRSIDSSMANVLIAFFFCCVSIFTQFFFLFNVLWRPFLPIKMINRCVQMCLVHDLTESRNHFLTWFFRCCIASSINLTQLFLKNINKKTLQGIVGDITPVDDVSGEQKQLMENVRNMIALNYFDSHVWREFTQLWLAAIRCRWRWIHLPSWSMAIK